jgi:hypothetical protein
MCSYLRNLKLTIVECYTSIVYGVKDSGDTSIFDLYVTELFQYLNLACNAGLADTFDSVKTALGLVGDLAGLYGNKIQQLIQAPFISRLLSIAEKGVGRENQQFARWAKNSLAKALK